MIVKDKNGVELHKGDTVKFLDGDYYAFSTSNGDSAVCYSIPNGVLFIFQPYNLCIQDINTPKP